MTNPIPAIVLSTLLTNAPLTNWLTPSGKEIEVTTMVLRQDVTIYTNENATVTATNFYLHSEKTNRFKLKEEWVEVPLLVQVPFLPLPQGQRPPPLPTVPTQQPNR